MITITNNFNPTDSTYGTEFWNALRMHNYLYSAENKGKVTRVGAYTLPAVDASKYLTELKDENFFRRLGTVIPICNIDSTVNTYTTESEAEWVAEGATIPDDEMVLESHHFSTHKLACIAKIHTDLLSDIGFDFQEWMLGKFARRFGRAERKAFISGNGVGQPVGILNEKGGAEVGVTAESTSAVTFDEVMALFHSLDPKFRTKAVWVMNDTTALALRTLKDKDGNYLWSPSSEKLLGKTVIICNEMPDIGEGAKPIAFGDFSYYWITERVPFAVRILTEKYTLQQLRGYVGYEHLDAKLIRSDTIKVMQMATAAE